VVDVVEFVRSTVEPMAQATFPFLSSIVGIVNETEGEYVGSGFRCILAGRRCLVTAAHVIEQASAFPLGGGFTMTRGAPPRRLSSTPDRSDASRDLAVYFLGDEEDGLEDQDIRFLSGSSIDPAEDERSRDYLFVHGFPGRRARFVYSELHMRSLPYGVMERDDDLPADMRSFEFAMDYDPNEMLALTGGQAEFVLADGLSGSPVFRIGANQGMPDEWNPGRAMLVGVITRWNHEKRVLLATGSRFLLELVRPPSEERRV